eukprot:scaffold588288_cov18-Prasinocladus_malaysianus.AAC.1
MSRAAITVAASRLSPATHERQQSTDDGGASVYSIARCLASLGFDANRDDAVTFCLLRDHLLPNGRDSNISLRRLYAVYPSKYGR